MNQGPVQISPDLNYSFCRQLLYLEYEAGLLSTDQMMMVVVLNQEVLQLVTVRINRIILKQSDYDRCEKYKLVKVKTQNAA